MQNTTYKTEKPLVVALGDIHGKWGVITTFCEQHENLAIIQVGDFGIGFQHRIKTSHNLDKLERWLKVKNVELFAIRGNHDDPAYFKGQVRDHITLLPDYSLLQHGDIKMQLIGGGISIDRVDRVVNKSWWTDEELVYNLDRVEKSDILITHVAPTSFPISKAQCNPAVLNYHNIETMYGANLLGELEQEKERMQEIEDKSECKLHVFGHYHLSRSYEIKEKNRFGVCLNINEFKEISRL